MNRDTRITAGLALLYFLNGFFNLLGPSKAFAPLVFFDSFLLALLSLTLALLPPFKKAHILLLIFSAYFALQGCFNTGIIRHNTIEIMLNIIFIVACAAFYIHPIISIKKHRLIYIIPALAFICTMVFGYYYLSVWLKLGFSLAGALVQLYLLARPDIVDEMAVAHKRFYLLTTIMIFFDLVYFMFLYMNVPQQIA